MSAERAGLRLCAAAEVQEDFPLRVEAGGAVYAVYKLAAGYFVTADHCTHGPGSLSEGAIIGDEIECPFHQGRFHIPTGRPTGPPCTEAVRTWTARVEDGQIYIDPAAVRA